MAKTINAKIRRALGPRSTQQQVHFHLQHDGRPFVCDVPHCDSPALTVDEVSQPKRRGGQSDALHVSVQSVPADRLIKRGGVR